MDQVTISKLKAKLTSYLRMVRSGKTILVLDRTTPIAQIISLRDSNEEIPLPSQKATKTIKEFRASVSALSSMKSLKECKNSKIDVVDLLLEDREKRY